MLKIKVNGNRIDMAAYLSYYAVDELVKLTGLKEEEITFEGNVNDYFVRGHMSEDVHVEVKVTMPEEYEDKIKGINKILKNYLSYFEVNYVIYYELIDEDNFFKCKTKKVKKANEHKCECEDSDCDHENCTCDDEDCECKKSK